MTLVVYQVDMLSILIVNGKIPPFECQANNCGGDASQLREPETGALGYPAICWGINWPRSSSHEPFRISAHKPAWEGALGFVAPKKR